MFGFTSKHGALLFFLVAAVRAIPCSEYPHVKFTGVLHRNLGNAGPDPGEEGMKFSATLSRNGDHAPQKAEFHIKAEGTYVPSWNEFNGLNGEWARINFQAGTASGFTAYFWDPATSQKIELEHGYLTFSDLDGGPSSKEFVAVKTSAGFSGKWWAGPNAALKHEQTTLSDSWMTSQVDTSIYENTWIYSGSSAEMGMDNPNSGDQFTLVQKNNAVTLQSNTRFKEIQFKLGATPGTSSRTIQFNFQATQFCATTQMPDGTIKQPLEVGAQPKAFKTWATGTGEDFEESKFGDYQVCYGDSGPHPCVSDIGA